MFKVGDIVECLRDWPYGASIEKGDLAVIRKINDFGDVTFDNWPEEGFNWSADAKDFKLHLVDLENK